MEPKFKMTPDDIYGSKARYEKFVNNLEEFTIKPRPSDRREFYCKNKNNLKYFKILFKHFDSKDLSYSRRLRILSVLKMVVHYTPMDLCEIGREKVNNIVFHARERNPKSESIKCFIKTLKALWRVILPEKDQYGRDDETICPYNVRHLKATVDKSREKLREDRLTPDEFEQLVNYFKNDSRLQAYLTLSLETLCRPQELLYTKLRDVSIDSSKKFARINISSHTKEGVKQLQSIDSFFYLNKWLKEHPRPEGDDGFLFINLRKTKINSPLGTQLTNYNINKFLRKACQDLNLKKPVTCYSLKRCGVTFRRLKGEDDWVIQKVAGWSSGRQLQTYDLSKQEDAFKEELRRKGIVLDKESKLFNPSTRKCTYCQTVNGYTAEICTNCRKGVRIDEVREKIWEQEAMKKILEIHELLRKKGIKV